MNRVNRKKNDKYTHISNVFVRDKNLSLKAKGLMALIMSLPEDWDFSINGLSLITKERRDALYSIINELKDKGYCFFEVSRDSTGKITGTDYTFLEEPCLEKPYTEKPYTEKPYTENPDTAKPYTENPTQINKEITNNEKKGDTNVSYEGEPSRGKEESISWDAFLKCFNDTMANKAIKPISVLSEKRKGNIRARMREYGKKALFEVIQKAAASDFLNGKNQRGFMATFDWLFAPNNFPKVLEGNYENREGQINFNNNNSYGRETVTDKMRRTIAEAEDFDRQLTAQREANMGNGDSKPVW